jgi:hypothetical protein
MFLRVNALLILFFLNLISGSGLPSESCRPNGATNYRKFATKTPYAYIADSLGNFFLNY